MASLLNALGTASHALDVMEQAMGVVQNNVSNSAIPGYVTQTLQLNAGLFDPSQGEWGGVASGNVTGARSNFAESSVWAANQQLGSATQQSTSLQALQAAFDVSGTSGIPGALNTLYSAFSAWSTTPSSATAQQQVLSAAQGVAQAFNSTSSSVAAVQSQTRQQTASAITQINQLSSQIAAINAQIRNGGQNDGGLQAQLYNNLEQLSNLTSISAHSESDGTMSVLIGDGQVPLVTGATAHSLRASSANVAGGTSTAAPGEQILDDEGTDVTAKIEGGQLGGLLQIANTVLPSVVGNASGQGTLNQLAQGIADRVNTLLTSGQTSAGAAGIPLFSYNAASPTTVAGTLTVNPAIASSQLAAIDPGPPAVANGIAAHLAQLQSPTAAADTISGQSFSDFYSSLASSLGTLAAGASAAQQTQTQVLSQAQSARSQVSGVSLNDQAAALLQFQDAYQASAQALATIKQTLTYFMQSIAST